MRKKRAEKRRVAPDPRFNDVIVAKFVNNVMDEGKKATARTLVYNALDMIGKKTEQNPLDVFRKAIQNASPALEIRPRRVGGATYQVPMEVREERRVALAIRWIKKFASERRDRSMAAKLASELMAAANGEGGAIKRRDEMHRMADANRAFAHFKW
ncbi:MAG: 30S ribosomal protein S7 ['Candidatus Kapabacteria' thiocyanatum]|uniref:Small ribosomal subunit protein uS7 n=1 Tax=Candidatus Kapaibacterium thiocyanatum TaxID=1895771 RepID=A0A1M3KW93_9BACT|nr:30S ribosomal protein S7 ['Candidatus Kapabacteria' thiocyanatum]OJX56682.1 MAG: 30S ribosomal protein S7 ['Candidatus Kapabacteria' thiocyanatum]